MVGQEFFLFVRNVVGVGVKMNKQKCWFCGAVHENVDFIENCIGKTYCGVIQLFCPTCGAPFEAKQSEFRLDINEN